MIVVADTGPLRYLILIEHVDILPALYGRVIIAPAVVAELTQERTPTAVRHWVSTRPEWLEVQAPRHALPLAPGVLGPGELATIALATELSADIVLMDDRDGRREAEKRNLAVLGTLRVLADASARGFADLLAALDRLQRTNFRADEQLIQRILDKHRLP